MILGGVFLALLYIDYFPLYLAYTAVLFFEGITNWRVPILINRMRYGANYPIGKEPIFENYRWDFEAERAMRLVFGVVLTMSLVLFPRELWFFNWLIPAFLALSGLVNYCPIVALLSRIGFK